MKKMITVFAFIVLCWTVACSNVKENNKPEIADSNYSTNVVADESASDDNLTFPMPKGRGFLVAAEGYRLTNSFLIGRTPS